VKSIISLPTPLRTSLIRNTLVKTASILS